MQFPDIRKIVAYLSSIAFIVATSFGVNAYFAKEKEFSSFKEEVKQDVAFLGKSFQMEQIDRRLESLQERLYKVEDRIRQVGPKQELIEQKRLIEQQMKDLEKSHRRLE